MGAVTCRALASAGDASYVGHVSIQRARTRLLSIVLAGLCGAALCGAVVCGAVGCGGSTPEGASAAEPERPHDAAQIAEAMVGGKVSALIFVDRVRTHSSAAKLLKMGPIRDVLEGTSFDPMKDIERVFVTSPSVTDERAVMFAEHTLTEERIPIIVQDLVHKSDPPGEVLTGAPLWTVKVSKRGRVGVVAFVPPRFVVVVPVDLVDRIDAFAETGGLPGPTGEEAAKFHAEDPSTTLRARGVPPVPPSISSLGGDIFLRPDGGMTLDGSGQSTAERAPRDAQELTKSIDDATSIGIGIIRLRAFRAPVFAPEGDKVIVRHNLSAAEVETIMGFAASFVR
jgi:hypothetical protein